MPRVRFVEREDLPAEQRHIYDELAASRGGVQRNFKSLLNSPVATSKMAVLGAYVGFETPLPPRSKSLAALTTAREIDGDYVWTVNQPQAKSAGLQELLRQHRISDATFKTVQQRLGDAGVIDLLMLIGYYHSLAQTLSALEVMPETPSTWSN
jgi:4-carboxymuconolactone decarboxylase